ncbi:MAG: C-type lectin domain-containing protein [Sandaracinaceae bacterium]|nr:C-type lectin domain-containing protein [Sandaracinaceae bacterium]
MRSLAIAILALLPAGCALDRSFAQGDLDAGSPPVDAEVQPGDASADAGRDAGPPRQDGGQCSAVDLCDGADDDCNPGTADGSGESWLNQSCDGDDSDRCEEGTYRCTGGAQVCSDATGDSPDVCDGMDNDCNVDTPDGAADTGPGMRCDGGDSDMCDEGSWQCVSGMRACSDMTDNSTETCNGRDDDCNGMIDDGAGCPCDLRIFMGRAYLFCRGANTETWQTAAERCAAQTGYSLVRIDSAEENRFIDMETGALMGTSDWWIGATDSAAEGTWVWTDGTTATYTNFESDQPNGGAGQNCAEIDPSTTGATGTAGGWNDQECGTDQPYVCEATP